MKKPGLERVPGFFFFCEDNAKLAGGGGILYVYTVSRVLPMPSSSTSIDEALLRQYVWRGGALLPSEQQVVSTGFPVLDEAFPGGGWPEGAFAEILCTREGAGELQIVLPALVSLSTQGRRVVLIAPPHLPYAPAFVAAGVRLSCVSVLKSSSRSQALWAGEQIFRADVCGAVLIWLRSASYAELRRLTLAAEKNRGIGFVFLSSEESTRPSPACLRVVLTPEVGGFQVRILKRRGAPVSYPLHIPLSRSIHAVARPSFSASSAPIPVPRTCIA